jgi:phosphoribosyl 1,2-cyclic phosphodiesterase
MPDDTARLSALVLGAAAGRGIPQWNCGCRLCRLARAGDPWVRPATQASVAISGDGDPWVIVGVSSDLRQQILQTPCVLASGAWADLRSAFHGESSQRDRCACVRSNDRNSAVAAQGSRYGTLFTDDEMIVTRLGAKTGRQMGHVPISRPGGTLEDLSSLSGRRILLHINNSNTILLADSPERQQVEAAGFEIAYDRIEVLL